MGCLSPLGCITKIPWMGELKQQTFISFSSETWEVQDQGCLYMFGVWREPTSWFFGERLFAVFSHGGRGKGALRGLV